MDADLDAERRTNVAALHDGTANPDIARKADGFEGVVEGVSAGIANERMIGVTEIVILQKFVQIADVFELTCTGRGSTRESPIACGRGG